MNTLHSLVVTLKFEVILRPQIAQKAHHKATSHRNGYIPTKVVVPPLSININRYVTWDGNNRKLWWYAGSMCIWM